MFLHQFTLDWILRLNVLSCGREFVGWAEYKGGFQSRRRGVNNMLLNFFGLTPLPPSSKYRGQWNRLGKWTQNKINTNFYCFLIIFKISFWSENRFLGRDICFYLSKLIKKSIPFPKFIIISHGTLKQC